MHGMRLSEHAFLLQALTLWCCVALPTAIIIPRRVGTPVTYTDGYLAHMDPFYYLTSYSSVTFRQSTRFRRFYNSSVAKYLFSTLNYTWICYLHNPDVRLEHVVVGPQLKNLTQFVYVVGIVQSNEGRAQALYIASILVIRSTAKIRHTYTSSPMRRVEISALSAARNSLVVCGAMLRFADKDNNLENESNGGREQQSAAFAFEFDDSLNLNRSLIPHQNGTSLDKCSGATHGAGGSVHLIHTKYHTHHGTVDDLIPTSKILSFGPSITKSSQRQVQWQSPLHESTSIISNLNVTYIEPLRVILDRGSLYLVAKARTKQEPPSHGVVIVKLAESSGVQCFARFFAVPSEVTQIHGPVVASDDFVYTLVRRAEHGLYGSEEIRLSIWGVHDASHDRSSALWESDSIRGPATGLAFSALDTQVKALGVVPKFNMSTDGAEKMKHLYQALPLAPATNDAKDAARPIGSVGSQFLRITFVLAVEQGGKDALHMAVDMLAHLLRVLPQTLVSESKSKKSKNKRSVGERDKFALTLQGEDLDRLAKKLRTAMIELAVKRVGKGNTQLEKHSEVGRITLSALRVESRGISRNPGEIEGGRSTSGVVIDFVSNLTIVAVCIAAVLILLVVIVVLVTQVISAMKPSSSESECTQPELRTRTDRRTLFALRPDGTLDSLVLPE